MITGPNGSKMRSVSTPNICEHEGIVNFELAAGIEPVFAERVNSEKNILNRAYKTGGCWCSWCPWCWVASQLGLAMASL